MSQQKDLIGLEVQKLNLFGRKLDCKHSWNHGEFNDNALKMILRKRNEEVTLVSGKHNEREGRWGRESRIPSSGTIDLEA